MKKTWKRLTSLLLAVFLVAAMLPAPVASATATFTLPAAPTLSNFERVDTIPENGLDTNKKYLILTQTTNGTTYALYASDAGRSIACGDLALSTSGTCAVKLTIADGEITGFQHMLSGSSAQVELEDLLFTVAKGTSDPAKYTFTANGSGLDIVGNKMFKAGTSELSVNLRTAGTTGAGVFDIHNGDSRFLYFNDPTDTNSAFKDTAKHATDFCAFNNNTTRHFPIYLYAYNDPATNELSIPGYTQVKTISGSGLEHANYLIVADVPDGAHAGYYVLYPGAIGAAANADNVRKLTVDGNLNATGWTKWNSTSDKTFGTADTADFSVANNEISYISGTGLYSATAAKVGASGTTYHLFHGTQQVYQESGPSAFTITAIEDNPGHFYLRNTDSSKHSYLIYFTTNSNFNQNSTLGGDYRFQGDMMLFKSNTPLPEEPEPSVFDPATALPGYTLLTESAFNTSGLDETKYYMFVAYDQNNNPYALRYDESTAPGDPHNESAARLTVTGNSITAHAIDADGAATTTAVSMDKLHFFAEAAAGGKYQFHAKTGDNGLMLTDKVVGASPTDLLVQRSASTNNHADDKGFDIAAGTGSQDRHLAFNVKGATDYAQFTGHSTGFFGPKNASYISVYLYTKDGETAPTAWDRLQKLIEECEDLKQNDYTQATWAPFNEKLTTAKEVQPDANNADIKAALTALTAAKGALQLKPTVPDTPTATVYVRDTNGLDNNGVYGIFIANGNNRLMHSYADSTATNQCGGSTFDNDNKVNIGGCGENHLWTVATTDNGATVTIKSVSSQKYLTATASGSQLALSDTPVTFTVEKTGNGYALKSGNNYVGFSGSGWHMTSSKTELWFYKETEEPLNENDLIKDWKALVPTPGTTQNQPFVPGTVGGSGGNNYRIPALSKLSDGTLIAAADERWNHAMDACSLDTVFTYSQDNGATWHYSFINYFGDGINAKQTNDTAFIDPVIVADKNDTVYVMVDLYPGGVGINTAPMVPAAASGYMDITVDNVTAKRLVLYTTPKTSEQTNANYSYYIGEFDENGFATVYDVYDHSDSGYYVDEYYYLYYDKDQSDALGVDGDKIYCQQLGSTKFVQQNVFFYNAILHVRNASYLWILKGTPVKDGDTITGFTWSKPIMINSQVRKNTDIFYGVGPGAGITIPLDNGGERILLPCYTFRSEFSSVIYSDNGGVTWTRSANMKSGSSESAPVYVAANDTTYLFTRYGGYYISTDKGATWSAKQTQPVAYDTTTQLSAIHYSQQIDGKEAIILSAPSPTRRTNGHLFVFLVEEDKSLSLAYTYEVTAPGVFYSYSSLTELSKEGNGGKAGDIGLLYEDQGSHITYKVIPYKDIVPTVTAKGFSGPYDGAPHGITVTVTGGQNVSVQYSTDQTTWTDVAPTYTDVGNYTVYYKVVGTYLTGSETVKIDKAAAPTITLTADKTILTGAGDIVFTVSGIPAGAGGTVTIADNNNTTVNATGPDANGAYTATVHLDGVAGTPERRTFTANYTGTNIGNATATCEIELRPAVTGATFTVTAQGFNGPYDGQAHGITVTANSDDVKITYCETADGEYSTRPITRTNAGSTVVYYKAVKGNDASPETIAGSATIFISKVNPPMVIEGDYNFVWDKAGYSFTVKGVPAADEGTFSLTSSETDVKEKTSAPASDGTLTYTATPRLPEQLRTYTFVAVFEPNENSNYNRFVRTHVVAVTLKEPPALSFNFASSVSSTPDSPYTGYVTIPFDDADHSPAEFLTFNSNTVAVQYAMITDDQEPEYSNEAPVFHQAGTYTVSCLGTDKHGELDSKVLTLTVTITQQKIKPNLQLTASPAVLPGGGNVTLTLTGVPREGTVTLTCDDPAVTIPADYQGTYMLNLPATVKTYTFTATYTPPAESESYEAATALCAVTVSAPGSIGGGGSGGGSTGVPGGVTNPDGSTTTTVTDPDTGAVTETTLKPDGTVQVVVTDPDGSTTTTITAPNGVVMLAASEPGKDVNVSVLIPSKVPETVVTVPAAIDYTTVAVDKKTGETVMLSVPSRGLDAMHIKLDGSADLTLVKIGNGFTDVSDKSWAKNAVDFTSARGLFQGTSATTFSPNQSMTRGMLVTVLARLNGVDTSGGSSWYAKGAQWAEEQGISDASRLGSNVTREQLATMLWRYAGCPEATGGLDGYSDGSQVSGYASKAMSWAVEQGIFRGVGGGALNPKGNATRAQVSTVILRLCEYLVK